MSPAELPWGDWQFYLVTLLAALGAWRLLHRLAPRRAAGDPQAPPCAHCAASCEPGAPEGVRDLIQLGTSREIRDRKHLKAET